MTNGTPQPTDHPALIPVSVLVTSDQKEEIAALTAALRTPENRLKKATVIRAALTFGLAELRRRHEQEGQTQP